MKFVKAPTKQAGGLVLNKGTYRNARGRVTNHPRKAETPVEFVGVDGEGVTLETGEHRYVLFGVGDQQIENPDGLHWKEVFEFLYSHYRSGTAFVGFYLGYDFAQMLKTLPEGKAWILLTTEGRALRRHRLKGKAPHPVQLDGWQFDILGMKRLRIRPKDCACEVATCGCTFRPWMYINDVGPFFQSSFLKAINPSGWKEGTAVVTPEEYETVRIGKEKRSTAVLDDDMRRYNLLENDILTRVMRTVDAGFHQIGIHLPPSKWFGPGQAAQQWLKNEGVPSAIEVQEAVPPWFMEAARMAYFGGWFEIFCHGIIPGISHEYDINSAYPHTIAHLPCLLHGTYSHGRGIPPKASARALVLAYANIWGPGMPDSPGRIGSMLHRDPHGRILRPSATEGWFWFDELKSAHAAGLVKRLDNRGKQQISRWVMYEPCECPPPMRNVAGLYDKRLQVGKKTPLGRGARLVYNSEYGKFAQSVGDPIFGNPVYASRITSECRRRILEAIGTHPGGLDSVAMVATDGVYFLSEHPTLPISSVLGEWDHVEKENLTLFKPGVYWDDTARAAIASGTIPSFKARGFRAKDFASTIAQVDEVFGGWAKTGPIFPKVEFRTEFAMTSPLQALRQGDWSRAGMVVQGRPVVQDSDPSDKRAMPFTKDHTRNGVVWRSQAYRGMVHSDGGDYRWIRSVPYEKRFGMEDPFSEEYRDQFGITEDGPILDVLAWILKGE